ncbi:MAG: AAA family ATPase, partial [Anaerolineales bacterium]|nr:AAA family ATPase [Anaerolineales bacterium]
MQTVLETQTRIISRILKNDFGRGGAWDFYWGAFYPKGSSRQEDAQLMLRINWENLEVGFYIGEEGQAAREKFSTHTHQHAETLSAQLAHALPADVGFGQSGKKTENTLLEFLHDPARYGFRATLLISTDEILQLPPATLTHRIADTFTRLFPFFLLATQDDPLPAIETHLRPHSPELPPIPTSSSASLAPPYPLPTLSHATGLDEPTLTGFLRALDRRKQAILYGPPGTGKTHLAEHLAKHLIGGTDGLTELVQFHPSYAYEDFV